MFTQAAPCADPCAGNPSSDTGREYCDPRQAYYQSQDPLTTDHIYTVLAASYDCAKTTPTQPDNVHDSTPILIDSGAACDAAGMAWLGNEMPI